MKKKEITLSTFFCTQCGKEGIPLARTKSKQREPGHLKNLWCPFCKKENNFVEIKPYGVYTKEIFNLEFGFRNFTEEGQRKVKWEVFQNMSKPTLYVMIGVPGSGKSTWAKKFCKKNNVEYISRDEIRFSLVKENEEYFSKEEDVYNLFTTNIEDALRRGKDVCADATHINKTSRGKLITSINIDRDYYDIIYVFMDVSYQTAIERNLKREGRARVPEGVIQKMFKQLVCPCTIEFHNLKKLIMVGG